MNNLTETPPNQVIAMLIATGKYSVIEIARQMSIPPSRVYALKASPLFQQLVTEYATRFQEQAIDDVVAELRDDALHNVRFLKDVRDGKEEYVAKEMPFRMQAAAMLFDRQVPKRSLVEGNQAPAVVINIGAERKARIDAALEEDGTGVLDITDLADG